MQIPVRSIAPVTAPTRIPASRTASDADPAGFASLLRQTVEAPAAIRTPTAAPPPVLPPARPPTSASPTRAGAPPAAGSASTNDAPAQGSQPSDAADHPSASAPGRGPMRARTAAADARAEANAATSADPAPSDVASGRADTDAAQQAGDKSRKAEARSASDTANGTTPTPMPTPPAQTQMQAQTPVPDAGRTPRAPEPRGAAGADGSAGQPSLGRPAAIDIATAAAAATESRGALAGAARDAGTSSVGAPASDPATAIASPAAAPPSGSAFAGLLAEHRQVADSGAPPHAASAGDGSAAAGAASAFAATPVFGTSAAPSAEVAAPVGSPDFARQFGVQISVLAKDGVQHAELHLNPADMGPVSVQITMDGTQARIDFGAEVAATRHAIENGLPQLASALADAGFTLAGGGVSQHGGGSGGREQSGGGGRASGTLAPEAMTAAAVTRRVATVGGLDLYA